MKIFPALLCAALFFNGVAAAEPRGFDFAAEAARGNVRLVGGVYTNIAARAGQIETAEDGWRLHFDRSQMEARPNWCTVSVGGDLQIGDWLGRDVRLVMRRTPFRNVTKQMAVNFTDRDGETFQYLPREIRVDEIANEIVCTFRVSAAHSGCWGGGEKANKQQDLPLRFTSLNGHFAAQRGKGEMTLVRFEVAEPVSEAARTIRHHMPISVDTTYPGAEPFPAADELVFRVEPACTGKATLTLSANSTGSSRQGEMLHFTGSVKDGELRFRTDLPYGGWYEFCELKFASPEMSPRIVSAEGVFRQTAAEVMRLDVETGNQLHIVRAEKPNERAVVTIHNPAQKALRWQTELVFSDVFGKKLVVPFDRVVAAGETVRVPAPKLPAKGLWFVDAEVKGEDGSTARKSTRFAFIDLHERTPFTEKPKFRCGIHYHGTYYLPDLVDPTIEALVAAGAKFTRTDYSFMFSDIMSSPEAIDNPAARQWSKADDLLKRMRAAGLSLEIIIGGTPGWAVDVAKREATRGLRRQGCLPSRPGLFKAFCRAIAERYGTAIDYYEIGNEWDLTPPGILTDEEALRMQREAYEGVHEGCPKACVTPNGWASASSRRLSAEKHHPGMIENFAAHPELYDAWTLHCHGSFEKYVAQIQDEFLPLRAKTGLGMRPWLSGETAQTSFGGDEILVARTVWAKMLYAWAWGARDYIWYNLRATGWLEGSEPGYGLITASLHPRAGYASFAAFTTIFQGLDFEARLISDENLQLFCFRGEKVGFRGLVVAGFDWEAETPRRMRLRTDAKRAEISDYMGNRTKVPVVDGEVEFVLDANPKALLLWDAERIFNFQSSVFNSQSSIFNSQGFR